MTRLPNDLTQTRIVSRSRPGRRTADLFDWAFGAQVRELIDEEHALKLAAGEFKTKATPKGHWFVTTRNQSDRLAHAADRSYTVWRRTPAGPKFQRLVARGFCGQWVMQARRMDRTQDKANCQRCIDTLDALLKADDEQDGGTS